MGEMTETAGESGIWVRMTQNSDGSIVIDSQRYIPSCPALWEGNDTVEGLQDKFPCELQRGHGGPHRYTAEWEKEWTNQSGTLDYERVI